MTWRVESPGQVYDAGEGSVVYFDPRSGDTHLLSDFAAYLLEQLGDGPLDTGELVARVAPDVEGGDPAEVQASVTAALEDLVSLDILKRG